MKNLIVERHKHFWTKKSNVFDVVIGLIFLSLSLLALHQASIYVTLRVGNPLSDIVLDNIPLINTGFIYIYFAVAFFVFVSLLLLCDPKKIPFALKAVALFIITRSLFVILTHLGPPTHDIIMSMDRGTIQNAFTSVAGADLFFSGHTGLPFLFALMYWYNKSLRYFFIICSIGAGAAVLLGHIHYSIDVASAFFITYGVFNIALRIFKKDYARMAH